MVGLQPKPNQGELTPKATNDSIVLITLQQKQIKKLDFHSTELSLFLIFVLTFIWYYLWNTIQLYNSTVSFLVRRDQIVKLCKGN